MYFTVSGTFAYLGNDDELIPKLVGVLCYCYLG